MNKLEPSSNNKLLWMKVRPRPMNYSPSWREISNLAKIYWKNYKKQQKMTTLKGEMEEFSILALDGDEAV